ncbi:MAG: hypothetical protein ACJAVM_000817 [Sulfitobacter sp.]
MAVFEKAQRRWQNRLGTGLAKLVGRVNGRMGGKVGKLTMPKAEF